MKGSNRKSGSQGVFRSLLRLVSGTPGELPTLCSPEIVRRSSCHRRNRQQWLRSPSSCYPTRAPSSFSLSRPPAHPLRESSIFLVTGTPNPPLSRLPAGGLPIRFFASRFVRHTEGKIRPITRPVNKQIRHVDGIVESMDAYVGVTRESRCRCSAGGRSSFARRYVPTECVYTNPIRRKLFFCR